MTALEGSLLASPDPNELQSCLLYSPGAGNGRAHLPKQIDENGCGGFTPTHGQAPQHPSLNRTVGENTVEKKACELRTGRSQLPLWAKQIQRKGD